MKILFFFLLLPFYVYAQDAYNPFEAIQKNSQTISLSQWKFEELYADATYKRIGDVIFNTKTNKVEKILEPNDSTTLRLNDQSTRWLSLDPLAAKYPSLSPYNFVNNNPIIYVDPDGREPIKSLIGTSSMYRTLLNNSPSKVGLYTGIKASTYLKNLGNTKFSWKKMRPLPTETGFFNKKEGRYIYTEKGGWIDVAHFMFYAGKALQYKLDGKKYPIGEAVQDGYMQATSDKYAAKHSAYSYEGLPSDKFGAEFAVKYFHPKSSKRDQEHGSNFECRD